MSDRFERVMVVTAHPDDAEFGAAGTIAKLVQEGCEVTYVIVTNGNKGSNDRHVTPERLAETRVTEQRQAARTLGVERVEFLGYPDGEVEDTRALRCDVTRQIRRWRPDLLITQNPQRTYNLYVSHRDHRVTGGVVLDCVRLAPRIGALPGVVVGRMPAYCMLSVELLVVAPRTFLDVPGPAALAPHIRALPGVDIPFVVRVLVLIAS